MSTKVKILFILNDSHPLKYFLRSHINYLNSLDSYEISVILNNSLNEKFEDYNIRVFHFNIKRTPDIWSDFITLLKLILHLIKNRYDIIHSITPKSGLLSAISSFLTLNPIRIHTFTGQVWANYSGVKRLIFKVIDKIIYILNTHIITDSISQKNYLVNNNIGKASSIYVLNKGSICGVDLGKFFKTDLDAENLRKKMGLKESDFVVIYVGRLNFDKGILDLINAFLKFSVSDIHLLILGKDEANIKEYIYAEFRDFSLSNIHFISESPNPELYMSVSDVLCLPSYREGFGNVVIEAAALGLPSIVSNIYGLKDSILEDKTGVFFNTGDVEDLYSKLQYFYNNKDILKSMGEVCKIYIKENFDSNILSKCLAEFYLSILK